MKKIILATTLVFLSLPVFAGFVSESSDKVCNISEVLKMKNNAFVVVQGNIVKQVGDEKYLFTDGKSEIVVEIDEQLWTNITVSQKTKVKIFGEIDKDFNSVKLDVSKIEIIK